MQDIREFKTQVVSKAEELLELLSQDVSHDLSIARAHVEHVLHQVEKTLAHAIHKATLAADNAAENVEAEIDAEIDAEVQQ